MAKNQHKYHKIWNQLHPDDPILPNDGNDIHHKDFNHDNDNPSNLEKMKKGKHRSLHHKGKLLGNKNPSKRLEVRQKISESKKGTNHPMYGKKHTKETKIKMSLNKKGENHPQSKLTQMTVDWIRNILNSEEYKEAKKNRLINQTKLAKLFGVNERTISNIKLNKKWIK